VIPPGPRVPRVTAVSDAINLLSGKKIATGMVKVVLEEIESPDFLEIRFGGRAPENVEHFCVDPRIPKYEVNFRVPEQVGGGAQRLDLKMGRKQFAPIYLEVVRES
jgi:hypothetical protein